MISYTDESLRKRSNREIETIPIKKQKFVLVYGTKSSGYAKVQSDFSSWTKKFQIYPWAWALPEISPSLGTYEKDQNFKPFIESLVHLSTAVPEVEYEFDKQKRIESKFFLSKFQDGFIEQWVQHKNILMGSDELNIVIDERNGDDFLRAFLKTLPWRDSRYTLLNEGILSVIILHRSTHKNHIKELWANKAESSDVQKTGEQFSSWFINDFNFDVLDSYGLAHKLSKEGISVSLINVDDIKGDISHFITCNLLHFSKCDKENVPSLVSNYTEVEFSYESSSDIKESVLDDIEKAIKVHEEQYKRCLESNNLIESYPMQTTQIKLGDDALCPDSNEAIKNEIRNIVVSSSKVHVK